MQLTVIVTGATGFAGSHVLEELNRIGHKDLHIIAACRDPRKLIEDFDGEVRAGDLRDPDYLDRVLAGADVVCHCAAWNSMWGHRKDSRELHLEPTLALINKAMEWRVKRFINISSLCVADPAHADFADNPGRRRGYWPHLNNLVEIENTMRENTYRGTGMVNLRFGVFTGERYSLGLLPLLLPRLQTRLLPWLNSGRNRLPMIDGRDIGQAMTRAALIPELPGYAAFNIMGPETPTVRELVDYVSKTYAYPRPWLSLPFFAGYSLAWLMERVNPLLPGDPLLTRSLVQLLQGSAVNNAQARQTLGYQPEIHWKESVCKQIDEMRRQQFKHMSMHQPRKPLAIADDETD